MPSPPNLQPSPKLKANFLSNIFFWWLNSLFFKGYRGNLEFGDLYAALPEDESKTLDRRFEEEWGPEDEDEKARKNRLFQVLWRMYGRHFVGTGFVKFFEECVSKIASPLALGVLIGYFMGERDQTIGLLAGSGIVLGLVLNIATMHLYFLRVEHIGMKMRLACSSALFRKALKLKVSTCESAAGQLMNLISNDVNKFDNLQHIHYIWIGAVQTAISTYILWQSFGPACLSGLAVLILFVPLQGLMGALFTKFRTKIVTVADKRIRSMSEILKGIRAIKMHCWENIFAASVEAIRREEMLAFTKVTALRSVNWSLYYTSSKVTIFLTLIIYVLGGHTLSAEKVFVAVSLYNNIRITMTLHFPLGIAQLADFCVAIKRVQVFLSLDSMQTTVSEQDDEDGSSIVLENVYAARDGNEENQFVIIDANCHLEGRQLVTVVGPVGSGKSSLIQVVLRELVPVKGNVKISGKLSYSSQEACIFSGTIRDNILFGNKFDPERYDRVVYSCALKKDFELLAPYGDQTVIGDRGANLSGGQKARINLARAIYLEADIYLLDDPLSAVDAEVSRHIFKNCLKNFLHEKLVLLVTHQIQFLPLMNKILVLNKGRLVVQGTYQELLDAGVEFQQIVEVASSDQVLCEKNNEFDLPMKLSVITTSSFEAMDGNSCEDPIINLNLQCNASVDAILYPEITLNTESYSELEEEKLSGTVKFSVYRKYFGAGSNICSVFMLIVFNLLTQSLYTGSDYWLQIWSKIHEDQAKIKEHFLLPNAADHHSSFNYKLSEDSLHLLYRFNSSAHVPSTEAIDDNLNRQMLLYCSIIVFLFIFSIIRTTTFFQICISASVILHKRMLDGIMQAPIKFFDLNPTGRILNRFTKDLDLMDDAMPQTFFESMEIFLNVFGVIVLVCIVSPYILVPTVVLAVAFYFVRQVYVHSARSVKRLEAIARSPVYSHVSATLNSLSTIRAFKAEEQFCTEFFRHQDTHTSAWFLNIAMTRWIGMWLDWISVAFVTAVVLTLIFTAKQISGPEAGMAISSAMFLTGVFQWGVRQSATVESQMVSIERILDYTNIQPEALQRSDSESKPPEDWPTAGKIDIIDVSLSYRNNRPPVLKQINVKIMPREKIGIVGRTGAGKSSLIAGLFRLVETEGTIQIDGVITRNIGLHDLRSKISIIPQDPFLFQGTLRSNLNCGRKRYSDSDLWTTLTEVGLAEAFRNSPLGLDTEINEGGTNLSVGQRQLLCLARAILKRNKILILDEATANVDIMTDYFVQKTIREKFQDCTVITIAHRLFTVMDSERVLVMDEGTVKEFDSPYILLGKKDGILKSMVDQTGVRSSSELHRIAAEAYFQNFHRLKYSSSEA